MTIEAAIRAITFMMDDLVWSRTYDFSMLTVVEGMLRRLYPNIGETQGGLFSALRYVVAKAFSVDYPLSIEFPDEIMRSIVDDGIMQMHVQSAAHVERLVAWMERLDELVRGENRPPFRDEEGSLLITGVMGRLNFGKFKCLQHRNAVGTAHDLDAYRHRFPHGWAQRDGVREKKFPAVVRDVLEFNGAAIGFDDDARRAHVMREAAILDEKAARLLDISAALGRQRTELYGRASYRPSSVLVHQMRANPPSIAGPAMDRATQIQLHVLRAATGASPEMVGGAMEEWSGLASERACACRCSLSCHLQSVLGGCNWPEPRLMQPFAHVAKVVDTYVTITRMADMSDYPTPATWSACAVPALREAAATLERLVRMRGFHRRPPGDSDAWERVHRLLAGPGDTVLWDNIPKLAGGKLQRVATRAHALDLLMCALQSPTVPRMTKIRLLAAAQPGAGEWCCLAGRPNVHVHLTDHEFQRGFFARIGHPDPLVTLQTRCVCHEYSWDALPSIPGCNRGLASRPTVSTMEHALGVHWHQCLTNG